MKQRLIAIALLLLTSMYSFAHDFEVDGIFYNVLSEEDRTVEVTYKDDWWSCVYEGDIIIPSEVSHGGATYIVTDIGASAFLSCYGVTSIKIQTTIIHIGEKAFDGCSGLTSLDIPNSVVTIDSHAFWGTNLTSIEIPASVKFIGDNPFACCENLSSIAVVPENVYYDSREDCNAIIQTNSNTIITGCQSTIVPSSVNSIGSDAFRGCDGLTHIDIPNSVTSIGSLAFQYCDHLKTINLPSTIKYIGSSAFSQCFELTSIKIPDSVTALLDGVFSDCRNLSSIDIPVSITSIADGAFAGCASLESIIIPKSVTNIGFNCFSHCERLKSIKVDPLNAYYDSRGNCNAIIKTATNELISGCINTRIPNTVSSLASYAFHEFRNLTSIEIPSSVKSIGDYAFDYCVHLDSVIFKNNIPPSVNNNTFFEPSELSFFVPKDAGKVFADNDVY